MAQGPGRNSSSQEMKDLFGFVPKFYDAIPASVREDQWSTQRDLELSETAIPLKYKELIGLAIAAHIKCGYCIYFHTQAAKAFGASDEELKEASYMGGFTVQMSNAITGARVDIDQFRSEVDRAIQHLKTHAQPTASH